MSTHRETGTIEGCSSTEDAMHRLHSFYRANGYEVVEGDDKFERGKPGAGWWTSNMTELHTVVVVQRDGERIELTYRIDTSGQVLKEVEQAFWRRELQWARRYVMEETDEPRDLRTDEAERAESQTSEMRSLGLWSAVAIFFAIVALGFFGFI